MAMLTDLHPSCSSTCNVSHKSELALLASPVICFFVVSSVSCRVSCRRGGINPTSAPSSCLDLNNCLIVLIKKINGNKNKPEPSYFAYIRNKRINDLILNLSHWLNWWNRGVNFLIESNMTSSTATRNGALFYYKRTTPNSDFNWCICFIVSKINVVSQRIPLDKL